MASQDHPDLSSRNANSKLNTNKTSPCTPLVALHYTTLHTQRFSKTNFASLIPKPGPNPAPNRPNKRLTPLQNLLTSSRFRKPPHQSQSPPLRTRTERSTPRARLHRQLKTASIRNHCFKHRLRGKYRQMIARFIQTVGQPLLLTSKSLTEEVGNRSINSQ